MKKAFAIGTVGGMLFWSALFGNKVLEQRRFVSGEAGNRVSVKYSERLPSDWRATEYAKYCRKIVRAHSATYKDALNVAAYRTQLERAQTLQKPLGAKELFKQSVKMLEDAGIVPSKDGKSAIILEKNDYNYMILQNKGNAPGKKQVSK